MGRTVKVMVGQHCHSYARGMGCLDLGLLRQRSVSWCESDDATVSLQSANDVGELFIRVDVSNSFDNAILTFN
jgi:hypothetical protein